MKKIFLILAAAVVLSFSASAQDAYWRTSADIDLSERVTEYNGEISQPRVYEQKGGYRLILRPVARTENGMRLRATEIYIEKDGKLRLLDDRDECSDFLVNKYMNRYNGVDFDDYFIITIYDGAYRHSLYEKSSGKLILRYENSGEPIYWGNLLIYNDGEGENEAAYLFDLKTLKKYPLALYLEAEQKKMTLWGSMHWTTAFKILSATPQKATVEFSGFYKPLFDENGEFADSEDYRFTFDVELN